jgi:hypothetical protein
LSDMMPRAPSFAFRLNIGVLLCGLLKDVFSIRLYSFDSMRTITSFDVGSRWINQYGGLVEWYEKGKIELLRAMPVLATFCPP